MNKTEEKEVKMSFGLKPEHIKRINWKDCEGTRLSQVVSLTTALNAGLQKSIEILKQ